jgi:hypothetical protein
MNRELATIFAAFEAAGRGIPAELANTVHGENARIMAADQDRRRRLRARAVELRRELGWL